MIKVRRGNKMNSLQKIGPKSAEHPSIENECQACHKKFVEGDYTTLIILGPGDNETEQEKARNGRPYNAVAIEVHYSCATGEL
jgi:hypothetical protein